MNAILSELGELFTNLLSNIPILISVISLALSFITLWLTKFDGPDLTLLNSPEQIQLSNEGFRLARTQNYTPRRFELKPIQLLFANHGGKSGTILNWKLEFTPSSQFERFFEEIYDYKPELPITIERGDNEHFSINVHINTIRWKKTALVKLLDQKKDMNTDELVVLALQKSKEEFMDFCEYMEEPGELGTTSFVVTITKGRFRTRVQDKKLFENISVQKINIAQDYSLRKCLSRWELMDPNKVQLMDNLRSPIKDIFEELKNNLYQILHSEVENTDMREPNVCKVKIQAWNRLQTERYHPENKIRWFYIEREKGLKQELTELYLNLETYNNRIDELTSFGEQRTLQQLMELNAERKILVDKVQAVVNYLSEAIDRIYNDD